MSQIHLDRHFDKVLRIAAKGDMEGLKGLLSENPQILNRPSGGHNRTILWEAVNANRIELINYLVDLGANVNIPGRYRSQTFVLLKPYCIAHKNRKEDLKNYLLSKGHVMDVYSSAYLEDEINFKNRFELSRDLINKEQNEDKLWQVTPLHFAVSGNNMSTLHILLENGSEVKKYSKLLYEIASRNNRLDIIKLLTKYGGCPEEIDVINAFYTNNTEIIEYFVSKGLDCDKLFATDWPPIVYICRGDKGENLDKVKQLLKYVINVNAQTPKGVSALHAAAKAGYTSVIEVLLDHGADINIRDNRSKTPLHYSRKYKRGEVEEYLLENSGIE